MSRLTPEQEQALTELLAHIPKKSPPPASNADTLSAWTGLSRTRWMEQIQHLLRHKQGLDTAFLDWIESNPRDAIFEFLGVAALGFYLAEHGINPKVNNYVDAFYYISTCASVGYADIFAVTDMGKAIASLVMTVGPAFATRALDRPKR